jgi:hypothetical protein
MLPADSYFSCAFLSGGDAFIFSVSPLRQRRSTRVLSRRASSSKMSWRILSLVKKTLHRHRAGFETQRASSFRKWVKAPKKSEKPSEPERSFLSLFYSTFHSATGVGELYWRRSVIVTLCRPAPHQDCGRAGTVGSSFDRDDKEPWFQLGGAITRRAAS